MLKLKGKIRIILMCLSLLVFIYSSYQIVMWAIDNKNISNQTDNIDSITNIKEVEDNDNTTIIEQGEIDKSNPYWDYIKMNLIEVDFKELKEINPHTKAWLQVNGTNINYPVVQAYNNEYYLSHAFDRSKNNGGWVFLDYRNKLEYNEKNTIIYAHSRVDKSMFGSLKNILTSSWIKNTDNYIVKLSTEYENTLWQVFSVYRIPTTSDYLKISFSSDNEYSNFINMIKDRSQHNFNTNVQVSDRILTLSTCYNNDDKVVLHAKLIKREPR